MGHKDPFDLEKLSTHGIEERKSLVHVDRFVEPSEPPGDVASAFPDLLAGRSFRTLCRAVAAARRRGRPVVLAMGAHVIKCGLSLLIIDLMERGFVSALALNGAGAIHDWEIARAGKTSEDVAAGIQDGSFGMCRDTARALNGAARKAVEGGRGFGEVLGESVEAEGLPFQRYSLLAAGRRLGLPVTVHVCLGCDIVHMHADADGSAIGRASLHDFRRLVEVTARLDGGVWMNVGSAVVLPEVFLKTLSMARNLTGGPREFLSADLDMIRHYRPMENVVRRPGGRGVFLTGHHEIMLPLLRWGILAEARKEGGGP